MTFISVSLVPDCLGQYKVNLFDIISIIYKI